LDVDHLSNSMPQRQRMLLHRRSSARHCGNDKSDGRVALAASAFQCEALWRGSGLEGSVGAAWAAAGISNWCSHPGLQHFVYLSLLTQWFRLHRGRFGFPARWLNRIPKMQQQFQQSRACLSLARRLRACDLATTTIQEAFLSEACRHNLWMKRRQTRDQAAPQVVSSAWLSLVLGCGAASERTASARKATACLEHLALGLATWTWQF
jgi:hypothetical protein